MTPRTKKVEKQDMEAYLAEAKTWETDKVREADKSKKTAWRVATASGVVAFMAVAAVAMLAPLKEVDPFVIRVDNSTGVVDVVNALQDGKTTYDEAVNKYFVQWYIRYREGYTRDLAEAYYGYVGLMSNTTEQQKFYNWFNPKNPRSPLAMYGNTAKVNINILSTSFVAPNIALVRYIKSIQRGLDKPEETHWAATVTFRFTKAPMSEKDRAINPLGFQVTDYRNDPETVANSLGNLNILAPQEPAPAPATAAPVALPGQAPDAPQAAQPANLQ